jgi:NAD(P)-dependent dehydrogenase (short-subunit alcohol dehydrogenase family)
MTHYLIIAGSSDIGFATAQRLIHLGHQVTITSRRKETSDAATTIGAKFSLLDASNFLAVQELFESITQTGPLDGVVNCAGSIILKPAHLCSEDDYHETIKANLTTAFAIIRAASKTMLKHGGSVVLIASAAALVGLPNHEAIAAAKAGIIGLALSAASTYAVNNLRINVIAPGLIETKLSHALIGTPTLRKISESMHPLNRVGTVNDIASAICFLLDSENSWITGEVLRVDGGLSHLRSKIKA